MIKKKVEVLIANDKSQNCVVLELVKFLGVLLDGNFVSTQFVIYSSDLVLVCTRVGSLFNVTGVI